MKHINIADDFSKYPGGRYRSDGPRSGEAFRQDVLAPALRDGRVAVEAGGVSGLPSGFLEEAFGGLVREYGFEFNDLFQELTLRLGTHTIAASLSRPIAGEGGENG